MIIKSESNEKYKYLNKLKKKKNYGNAYLV